MSDKQYDDDSDVLTRDETDDEVQEPSMYKVIFINDDYTPMEVVVLILRQVFGKEEQEANSVMLKVHKEGRGIAGVYTYDIANTKKIQSTQLAKSLEFPLKIELEEE